MKPIEFDEIPRYSTLPAQLLNPNTKSRYKNKLEVQREYDQDKWGALLEFANSTPNLTLELTEDHHAPSTPNTPYYEGGRYYLATEREMLDRHIELYASTLQTHLAGASCLVELGAGFGSKILRLARRAEFSKLPLVAGEFTKNGRALIDVVARSCRKPIRVGYCDFWDMDFDDLNLPENAVIFTSYSVHYVPKLSERFIAALAALKPKVVVNFEPVYEYLPSSTLHGLMCRRYMEINDYTRNLGTVIENARARGELSVTITKNILGSNPFLPISAIEWTPAK
jgi:hypothetical protein